MNTRPFGRTDWQVSEIGYGMWGMGGWSDSDDQESLHSLQAAYDLGCNFFDTAYAYGDGHSEKLLGQTVRANPDKRLYTATKIPPGNKQWPRSRSLLLMESYPPDHVEEFVHRSLEECRSGEFRSDAVAHLGRMTGCEMIVGSTSLTICAVRAHQGDWH